MVRNRDLKLFHLTLNLQANSADPDQTPRSAASDLGITVCQCPKLLSPDLTDNTQE